MASKKISLSRHPFLLAKGMRIPALKRRRKVWAFLPNDYFLNNDRHYPVIYFNDGQNIFEGWKAPFGKSWEAHQTMQKLSGFNSREHILIGIEHGKKYRKGEYMPFSFSNEGNAYADFIANDLKLFVDKNLRTLPNREHNAVIGSSLGGLSALYTGFKHQDVFSKVGVLSPSLWAAPQMIPLIQNVGRHYPTKFFLSVGSKEGRHTIEQVKRLYNTLLSAGFPHSDLRMNIVKNGRHNELLWQSEFADFYQWVY